LRRIYNHVLSCIVTSVFLLTTTLSYAQTLTYQSVISPHKPDIELNQSFTPTLLEGLIVYPDNPLSVNFVILPGQDLGEGASVSP